MILLERLLAGLDVQLDPFALCRVRRATGADLGRHDDAVLHYVLIGSGTVLVEGCGPVAVSERTMLVSPPGQRQRFYAGTASGGASDPPLCDVILDGGPLQKSEDDGLVMVCSAVHATYQQTRGLFDHLREPIVVPLDADDSLAQSFDRLIAELAEPQPGTKDMGQLMLRQSLILLLRRYCEGGECRLPWLSALEDHRLGAALELMLAQTNASLTVQDLAQAAGMSRSAFSQHFADAFEQPPMEMLQEIRLRHAAKLLRETDMPVKQLAARLGYASRSHFSRSFSRQYGVAPADYRDAELQASGRRR